MIRIRRHSGASVLEGDIEPGVGAYMDAEWLGVGEGGELPVMTVDAGGVVRFGRHGWQAPAGFDAERAAFLVFSSFAQEAVDALTAPDRDLVTVTGTGIVAAEVRRLLALAASSPAGSRPAAAIDTTGDPDVIVDAARRLADGGALVLAGECLGRRTDIDLYPDVHFRSLQIVGVGPLLSQGPTLGGSDEPRVPKGSLAVVSLGKPLPSAMWYRVETSDAPAN